MKRSVIRFAVPVLLGCAAPFPIASATDPIWADIKVFRSGDPWMSAIGHWSVTIDMGEPWDSVTERENEITSAAAEAHARGVQTFADAYAWMICPDWILANEDPYTFLDAVSSVALSDFSVIVTWNQNYATEEEPLIPVAQCAISVELKPRFTAFIGPADGCAGANVTGAMSMQGWSTGAFASAQRSLWLPNDAVPVGGEVVEDDFEAIVTDSDAKMAAISSEEVTGDGYVFVAVGGIISNELPEVDYPNVGEYVYVDAGVYDSIAGMRVIGVATTYGQVSIVEVEYGWY